VPKKSGLITPEELAICARVRAICERVGWPQSALAFELGISRNKLLAITRGTTPLRYDLGRRICDRFGVSVAWLAAGWGDPNEPLLIAAELDARIPIRVLLSKAFFNFIEPSLTIIQRRVLKHGQPTGFKLTFPQPVGLPMDRTREWMILEDVRRAVKAAPENLRLELCRAIVKSIAEFRETRGLDIRADAGLWGRTDSAKHKSPVESQNQGLTVPSEFSKSSSVKSELDKLIARVKRTASKPGMKSELARALGVAPARITEWLSGKNEPGGGYTLQLLQWVEQQERQKT
jgi:transcriptional regulator with XRE-family HTH domain